MIIIIIIVVVTTSRNNAIMSLQADWFRRNYDIISYK